MKAFLLVYFLFSSLVISASTDYQKVFHDANIAYQKMDYEKSIELYSSLVKDGKVSSDVFYNLGNSYFKRGDFPKAILNYERAKKLAPDDEDISFNIKLAGLKVVDKMEAVPEIFYKRWFNALARSISADNWATLFVAMIWLLLGSAAYYFLAKSVGAKKLAFTLLLLFLLLSISSGLMASRSHQITYTDKHAIIMAASVYVKSSPDENGNDQFILHEGTKVEVLDELNEWNKIRIANGSVGWMKSDEMERI